MYSYHRTIIIDQDQVSGQEHLSDFPFLFSETATYLKTVGNGGKIQNSNGYDIIFTLGPDISSKLDHEIVNYDSVTGEFIAFVRIPTVYHDQDTTIHMYYGDSQIDNSQENAKGVWDSNFKAVYHLEDLNDSKNEYTLTNNNSCAFTTGEINNAVNLGESNTNKYLNVTNNMGIDGTAITISAWVKLTTEITSGYYHFAGQFSATTKREFSLFYEYNGGTRRINIAFDPVGTAGLYKYYTGNMGITNWHYLTITYDNTTMTAYYNGVAFGTGTPTGNGSEGTTSNFAIGENPWNNIGENVASALIDEVRVSNIARSAGWILTEYNNQNSPSTFYSVSNEILYGNYVYKRFIYKVFDGSTYVGNWSDEVLTEPQFRNVINGGPGEIIIRLNRDFDSFGEDVDVKLNNRVELYIFDRQYPNGQLVYKGFISGYRPVFQGNVEYVEVTVLSYVYELSSYILRDGSGSTQVAYNSQDPSDILKDVIDKYRADGGTLNYSAESIEDTNTTTSYTFKANTIREAIDKIIELAPVGWYWRVDPDSLIYFQPYNLTADHVFTIGTHINQMETWRRVEDVVNQVYFTGFTTESGTGLYRVYNNAGSISSYGRHATHYVDGRVSLATTADTIANRLINNKKDPEIRTRLTILDNNGDLEKRGYDIEVIKPGETMKIRNIKGSVKTFSLWDQFVWDVDIWDQTLTTAAADVIQILQIEYTLDSLTLEASSRTPEIAKRIEDIQRNLTNEMTVNNPATPTAG